MSDLEHPAAVYYDKYGQRHDIDADRLRDDDKAFEEAKAAAALGKLWDPTETISLSVKPESANDRRRHFFSKDGKSEIGTYGAGGEHGVDRETHDNRVKALLADLRQQPELPWPSKNLKLDGYQWEKEVWRIHSPTVLARHDLYGQRPEFHMSPRRPAVIIEVINTHYPEVAVLDALFVSTRQLPLVAVFDFVNRGSRFVRTVSRGSREFWARAFMSEGEAHVTTNRGACTFDTTVSLLEALHKERDASSA